MTAVRSRLGFGLLTGLFIAARLFRLTTYSLRADEIFSLEVATKTSWHDLFVAVARDVVHPPLFYALLRIWIRIGGDSEAWMRLLPVLTAVAALWPFYFLCRELKLRTAETNLACALFAINAYLIYYAQELRMYSLLLFFTLCSLWLFVRFFNAVDGGRRALVALFVVNLLLVYTQYYGWVVVSIEALILVVGKPAKIRGFLVSVAGVMLCFSPWAFVAWKAAATRGGLEPIIGLFARPQVADVVQYYALLNGSSNSAGRAIVGQLLFAFPILLWGWQLLRRTDTSDKSRVFTFWFLAVLATLPVIFSYLANQVFPRTLWGTRFLIIAAAPYLLLVATSANRVRVPWLKYATMICIVGWSAFGSHAALNDTGKRAWEPLVYQMIHAEPSQVPNIMVYAFGSSDETIAFYLRKAHETRFQTKRVFDLVDFGGDHFWVASRSRDEAPQQFLRSRGYDVGEGVSDGFGAVLSPVWRR